MKVSKKKSKLLYAKKNIGMWQNVKIKNRFFSVPYS